MTSTALQSSFGVGVPVQANGSTTASSCDTEIPHPEFLLIVYAAPSPHTEESYLKPHPQETHRFLFETFDQKRDVIHELICWGPYREPAMCHIPVAHSTLRGTGRLLHLYVTLVSTKDNLVE